MADTSGADYARRLQRKQHATWKRILRVQAPYQWNLRRQHLGRTLDIGCGIGRNLATLGPGSVGVDHNGAAVAIARQAGLTAYTVEEWQACEDRSEETFDGLLIAHVIEHLSAEEGEELVREYLPMLRPGGKVFFVCPQERGYASDHTHVRWTTGEDLTNLARKVGLIPGPTRSFPFPRALGRVFIYNEFHQVARKPL